MTAPGGLPSANLVFRSPRVFSRLMAKKRPIPTPRWALALIAGLGSAAAIVALLRLGVGLDLELSVFFGGALGLVAAFLVARWFGAAGALLTAVEIAASAFAVAVTIIAAIVGALS
jgi:hypothetical protein